MAITADDIIGSGPTARSYLWDVQIPGGGELFNIRCSTSAQPSFEVAKVETNLRGFTIPESGTKTWNDITFELIENDKYYIIKTLFNECLVVWDDTTGVHGYAEASTGGGQTNNTQIMLNNLVGSPVVTWTLHNCVIAGSVEFPNTASEKEGIYTVTFTVAYAYATMG